MRSNMPDVRPLPAFHYSKTHDYLNRVAIMRDSLAEARSTHDVVAVERLSADIVTELAVALVHATLATVKL
jgi:hypothetical protein